jgi:hypothetical protein
MISVADSIAATGQDVPPGGTLRFAVGSVDGPRSSTWRVWSARNTTDVYLAPRSIAGVQKISLHETGSWSHSFVSDEKAAPFVAPGSPRHVEIWQRQAEFSAGWSRGYVVMVPWTELRLWPEREQGEIVFAPSPGHGYWTHIEIIFVAAGTATALIIDEMYLLGTLRLADSSEVKVIARRSRPTRQQTLELANVREQAIGAVPDGPRCSRNSVTGSNDPRWRPRTAGRRHPVLH